jgi:O-antigen/teichoic acid export membrane protein
MSASRGLARKIVANTLHAASGRVAAMLVWLILTPWILRAIGTDGFAVWSLFLAFSGYLAALDLGIAQMALRHVAAARERDDHAEAGDYATLALSGYIGLGALWLVLGAALAPAIVSLLRVPEAARPDATFAIVAGGVTFLVAGVANAMIAVAQGYGRFDLANLVTLTLTIEQAIGIPIVLARGWGLRGLILNLALGWVLSSAMGHALIRLRLPAFRWSPFGRARARWREALRFGGPVQLNNVLGVLHQQIDKFLLVRFVALGAVTPYELGFRVAAAGSTFPQILLLALMPTASALHAAADAPRLSALYERGSRYVLMAAAVVLAGLIGGADRLYLVWLGPGHSAAALALRGLALAAAAALACGVGTSIVRGIGKPEIEARYTAIAFTVHVVLCFVLLPRFGLVGVLIAIASGNAVGGAWFLWRLAGELRWPRWRVMVAPFLVPALALAAGSAAGFGLDRALPALHGLAAWASLALIGGTGALVALAVAAATRYVALDEARSLLGAAPDGPGA